MPVPCPYPPPKSFTALSLPSFFTSSITTNALGSRDIFLIAVRPMYRGAVHKNNPDNVYIRLLSGLEKYVKSMHLGNRIGFSYLFSFYIDNFSNYSATYGSLTAVVLCMLWFYSCMYIMFIGAELNQRQELRGDY